METHLPVDELELLPIKEAVRVTEYTRDYITRLAREGKIAAAHLDRQWYVSLPSLRAYAEQAAIEQEVRKCQLRLARQRERDYHTLLDSVRQEQQQRAVGLHHRALVSMVAVMSLGLMIGLVGYQVADPVFMTLGVSGEQVASVGETAGLSDRATADRADRRSYSVAPLAHAEEGLLLLPHQATSAAPRAYFSDPVTVEVVAGQAYVRLRDDAGSSSLRRVPFATVPVASPAALEAERAAAPDPRDFDLKYATP